MPSLIDLRRRIRAVKSTQQITKAMKMIAAARMRRAQASILASRPFAAKMEDMFQEDKKKCEEITLDAWKHRGVPKRLSELVFWIWEPYY